MRSEDEFTYDAFLSYNPKDGVKAKKIAERLRADGLKVWFDQWSIEPDSPVFYQIERGLQLSRALILAVSKTAAPIGLDEA